MGLHVTDYIPDLISLNWALGQLSLFGYGFVLGCLLIGQSYLVWSWKAKS